MRVPARQSKIVSHTYPVHPVADARSMRGRIEAVFGSALPAYPPETSYWQERPLEPHYAFLFIDSMPLRIREDRLMCSKRLHLVLGVLPDGSKDILAFYIEDPAAEAFWPAAIRQLKARGVEQIQMVVAENCAAVSQSFQILFPDAVVLSNVRLALRKTLESLPQPQRLPLMRDIGRFFTSREMRGELTEIVSVREHPAADWQSLEMEAAAVRGLPAAVRKLVCTTTATESVVEKLRRRGLAKRGSFASRDAASRELVLVLQDAKGAWRVAPNVWQPIRPFIRLGK